MLQRIAGLKPVGGGPEISSADLPFAEVDVAPDHCSGCGLCARLCPTGALRFETEACADSSNFRLGECLSLCIDCAICAVACPEGAITFRQQLNTRDLWEPTWLQLVAGALTTCEDCGLLTAAGAHFGTPPRCHSCRQGAGVVNSLTDDAGLLEDLISRIPELLAEPTGGEALVPDAAPGVGMNYRLADQDQVVLVLEGSD